MKLVLDRLSKVYGEQAALADISLSIEETKCLVLIGPSGGGKSTTLRLIAGLEQPSSGAISIDGVALPDEKEELRKYRSSIGTVFQSYNLFPHLSAKENLTLPLRKVHGRTTEFANDRADELFARFNLSEHADKRPSELSGGQNQRVAIARAIAHNPDLILFDEPTSALDPEMTAEVLDVIEELIHEGKDCLIVTHQMGFAKRVSQHTAFVSAGRVSEFGASSEFFKSPREPETLRFLDRVLRY